jgi:hypothetical protein
MSTTWSSRSTRCWNTTVRIRQRCLSTYRTWAWCVSCLRCTFTLTNLSLCSSTAPQIIFDRNEFKPILRTICINSCSLITWQKNVIALRWLSMKRLRSSNRVNSLISTRNCRSPEDVRMFMYHTHIAWFLTILTYNLRKRSWWHFTRDGLNPRLYWQMLILARKKEIPLNVFGCLEQLVL